MKKVILMSFACDVFAQIATYCKNNAIELIDLDKVHTESPRIFIEPEPYILKTYKLDEVEVWHDEYKYAHVQGWNLPLTTKKHNLPPKHQQFKNKRLLRFISRRNR